MTRLTGRTSRMALAECGLSTTHDFARALLAGARVALTPGEAFGVPGFVRLSCATSMETLEEGSRRLLDFVARHATPTHAVL